MPLEQITPEHPKVTIPEGAKAFIVYTGLLLGYLHVLAGIKGLTPFGTLGEFKYGDISLSYTPHKFQGINGIKYQTPLTVKIVAEWPSNSPPKSCKTLDQLANKLVNALEGNGAKVAVWSTSGRELYWSRTIERITN